MDFIDDFIEEYKNNPCLWKADCTNFKNRTKRQEAYLKLIEVAAKHGEHYNIERTKQKINNLRCAFRQQLKKIIESKSKGVKEEPYCPKRRYFESLMFLKDEENLERKAKRSSGNGVSNTEELDTSILEQECKLPRNLADNIGEGERTSKSLSQNELLEEQTIEECYTEYSDEVYHKINDLIPHEKNVKDKVYECEKETSFLTETKSSRKRSSSTSSQISKEAEPAKRIFKIETPTIDLEKLCSLTCKGHNSTMEDHFSSFGKVIAHKLRTMDGSQAIYAEKIITDVLFHDLCEPVRINK